MKRFLCAFLLFASVLHAVAVPKKGEMIEDAELDGVFKTYIAPIYQVAGLDPADLRIYFIHNPELGAAAGMNHRFYIQTGLITESQDVSEILGVLAHEVAHAASHHVERRLGAMEKMERNTAALIALSVAGGVLMGDASAAAAAMTAAAGSGMRAIQNYTRGQEGGADQGAMRYAEKLGWSLKGLYAVFEKLKGSDYLIEDLGSLAPYVQTHPLSKERMESLEAHLKKSPYTDQPFDPEFVESFKRIKAKVGAFLSPPGQTLRKYPESDTSLVARYARAIAHWRAGDVKQAHRAIDGLIEAYPQDPYFYEFKGQIFLEEGKVAQAAVQFEKALSHKKDALILKFQLARTYIALNTPETDKKARALLDGLANLQDDMPEYWVLRATVYGRQGQEGQAQWMLAESAVLTGDKRRALALARRAKSQLTGKGDAAARGSANDLVITLEEEQKRTGAF